MKKNIKKRILTALLCGVLSINSIACNLTQPTDSSTTDTTTTQPQQNDPPLEAKEAFLSYDEILEIYDQRLLARMTTGQREVFDGKGEPPFYKGKGYNVYAPAEDRDIEESLGNLSSRERDILGAIEMIVSTCDDPFTLSYSLFDVNKDGSNELLFIDTDYNVKAIFAIDRENQDKPTAVLGNAFLDQTGIDEDGKIVSFCAYDHDGKRLFYQIAYLNENGKLDYHQFGAYQKGTYSSYYEEINGNRTSISSSQYNRLLTNAGDSFSMIQAKTMATGITLGTDVASLTHQNASLQANKRAVYVYRKTAEIFFRYATGYQYALTDLTGNGIINLLILSENGELLFYEWDPTINGLYQGTIYAYSNPRNIKADGTLTVDMDGDERIIRFASLSSTLQSPFEVLASGSEQKNEYYINDVSVSASAFDAYRQQQKAKEPLFLLNLTAERLKSLFRYPVNDEYYVEETIETDARSYEGVLEIYRLLVEEKEHRATSILLPPLDDGGLTDRITVQLRDRLNNARYGIHDSVFCSDSADRYCYTETDLDGDGTNELILMLDNCCILTVYTQKNGITVPLDLQLTQAEICLGENGILYTSGYSRQYRYYLDEVYLLQDGEFVLQLALLQNLLDPYPSISYWKKEAGTIVDITSDEYRTLKETLGMPNDLQMQSGESVLVYTKTHLDSELIYLFARPNPYFYYELLFEENTFSRQIRITKAEAIEISYFAISGDQYHPIAQADGTYTFLMGENGNSIRCRIELCSTGLWLTEEYGDGTVKVTLFNTSGGGKG